MQPQPTQTLGYPRIGRNREMKRALEAYWKGSLDTDALMATFWEVAEAGWTSQRAAGIDFVGVGDNTLYDTMLDWAVRFGLIAPRFAGLGGLTRYFAMARGLPGVPALDMTKWFDTNYHYLVPEFEPPLTQRTDFDDFLALVRRAQKCIGAERAIPIVIGPLTLLRLSRFVGDFQATLEALLPGYVALLGALRALGVPEVQVHEPVLVLSEAQTLMDHAAAAYRALAQADVPLNLVTYFDDLGSTFDSVVALPVRTLTLDFTRGDNLVLLRDHGWPADKTLAAGVVDGRGVWRMRPSQIRPLVQELSRLAPSLRLSASSSLQFVPYAAAVETELPDPLRGVLAFAEEKLSELTALAADQLASTHAAWEAFSAFAPADGAVQAQVTSLSEADFRRDLPYADRRALQVQLPVLPTTTIGSFPQTPEVRRLRARYQRGEISTAEYQAGIDTFIAYSIGVQDALGLDVLVHGEFERTDMVEYFAQKLQGFAFTRHGWVQSFGSRYVRPPIIYADISRPEPMTVREFRVAQALTAKPVKGMLTGPVTILNWSYPRVDIPRHEIAYQIALALRAEIADLEAAGARVVQVDEPALREGLPLKRERWQGYLSWAVEAFRLATAQALPATQLHTHMCYSEFGDILEAIDRLDADVISIENARSGDEMLRSLATYGYPREIGPGVYDIHSPVVPEKAFVRGKLDAFLRHIQQERIWVNPDCGLKTRSWAEVLPALRNIVDVVHEVRAVLADFS